MGHAVDPNGRLRAGQACGVGRCVAAMTPIQLAREIESAYDSRDRDTLLRMLARLVTLAEAALRPPRPPLEPSD